MQFLKATHTVDERMRGAEDKRFEVDNRVAAVKMPGPDLG